MSGGKKKYTGQEKTYIADLGGANIFMYDCKEDQALGLAIFLSDFMGLPGVKRVFETKKVYDVSSDPDRQHLKSHPIDSEVAKTTVFKQVNLQEVLPGSRTR
jgi:hypothetical protein